MSSAGTAYVDVEARVDELSSQIDAAVSSVDTQTIDVEAVADTTAAQADIDAIDGGTAEVGVDADTSEAESEIDGIEPTPVEVPVTADTEEAQKSIDDLSGSIGAAADAAGAGGGALGGLTSELAGLSGASAGATAGALAVVGGLTMVTNAAMDSEVVTAETNSMLGSLGDSAVTTADHIADLSTRVMEYSGFSDEAVASGANVLLMFDNIKSQDVFDRAVEGAADLARKMGTDVPGAARMLGRALQDPEAGMARLQRAGIYLSDSQKEMVASFMATGDVAAAQDVILGSLEGRIGNLAEDYGQTLAGQMDIAKEKIDNVAESLGSSLLPALGEATDYTASMGDQFAAINDKFAVLDGPLNHVGDMWNQLNGRMQGTGTVSQEVIDALGGTSSAADELAASVDELSQEIDDYLGGLFDVPGAQRDLQQSFADLADTMTDPEASFYDMADAQEAVVRKTADLIDAMNQQGSSQADMDAAIAFSIAALQNERDAGHITQQQFADLSGEIRNVPHKASTEVVAPGLMDVYHRTQDYRAEMNRVDATNPSSTFTAPGLASNLSDADRYWAQVSNLDGKTVEVYYKAFGSMLPKAAGGPVEARQAYIVGEEGPELFVPGMGGNITPAAPTAALLAGGSAGGGTVINVNVHGTATAADGQAVVDALRRYQQRNGPIPVKVSA